MIDTAMSDLICRERALRHLPPRSESAPDVALVDRLVSVASRAVEAYCRRPFAIANHDELHDGSGSPTLWLRHYPVVAVERVASGPAVALRVRHASAEQATVRVGGPGVELIAVRGGVVQRDEIPFASAATLGLFATAIGANAGWEAFVDDACVRYPSADLAAFPGAWGARDAPAELRLHARDVSDYDVDARSGRLRRRDGRGWCGGLGAFRVRYAAGFADPPEDVQEACAQLVAQLFYQTKRDPGLASETIPSSVTRRAHDGWSPTIRTLLAPYRRTGS